MSSPSISNIQIKDRSAPKNYALPAQRLNKLKILGLVFCSIAVLDRDILSASKKNPVDFLGYVQYTASYIRQ